MKKIAFIGAYDKTDIIIYIAKILIEMDKKVMVVDATVNQKAKYIVPVINPSKTYVTNFEGIDVAVGFSKLDEIKDYLAVDDLQYDFILYDIDSSSSYLEFNIDEASAKYFITSFDLYSLKKGIEILAGINKEVTLKKIFFAKEVTNEDDEYIKFLAKDYKINWERDIIYFPLEMGDQTVISENQRVAKIKFKKLTALFKDGLLFITEDILEDTESSKIRKVFRKLERGV